ncbi:MAG TPA: dihydrofolate reductase family protein [Anaerolineales bacterium]|nr:dihydrofolate reductase family protein [Anaerolineales bacterium]
MRKIIVSEFMSLDGVIEDPGGGENYEHGGWTNQYFNDEVGKVVADALSRSDAFLWGRVTYQAFAAVWPSRTGELADQMNGRLKYVASTTLQRVDWSNSTLVSENIVEEVTKLKKQPGKDILVTGSSVLIQTLRQQGLIDEYSLLIFPIILGSGKRLFRNGTEARAHLKLISAETLPSGVVHLSYLSERKEV